MAPSCVSVPRKLRHLDPGSYDRVTYLLGHVKLTDSEMIQKIDNLTKLMAIRPDSVKFSEVMARIELFLLKKSNYNFMIRNIPTADCNGTLVTYSNIRNTVDQFGTVFALYMNHGVAFFEMNNSVETHKLLNNMQIGKNIISSVPF
jgi:hypothetical protein